MTKYKIMAAISIVVMGIGSFMACLAESQGLSTLGSVLLLISIAAMSFSFAHWQP